MNPLLKDEDYLIITIFDEKIKPLLYEIDSLEKFYKIKTKDGKVSTR